MVKMMILNMIMMLTTKTDDVVHACGIKTNLFRLTANRITFEITCVIIRYSGMSLVLLHYGHEIMQCKWQVLQCRECTCELPADVACLEYIGLNNQVTRVELDKRLIVKFAAHVGNIISFCDVSFY